MTDMHTARLDTTNFRGSVFTAARWAALGQTSSQILRLGISLLLARLLSPSDFGLLAMAMVVVGFCELFKELGTTSAIVQDPELSSALLNSIFYLNLLAGVCGYALIYLLAPTFADIYSQLDIIDVLRTLAIALIFTAPSLSKRALLQRELKFGRLAIIELVSALSYGAIAVALALRGDGIWSLVIAYLGSVFIGAVLTWACHSWTPDLSFSFTAIKRIGGWCLSMTISQVFGYVVTQADKFLAGIFLGPLSLGLYFFAQRLMETFISAISMPVANVLFPTFSTIHGDDQRIAKIYTRGCMTIALLAFPALALIGVSADPFFVFLLGPKWEPVVPLIILFIFPTMIQCIARTVGSVYLAKGKPHWLLAWQIFAGCAQITSFFLGLPWGIKGVVTSYAVVTTLLCYPAFLIPFKLLNAPISAFWQNLFPLVIALGLLVTSGILTKSLLLDITDSPLLVVLLTSIVAIVFYIVPIYLLRLPVLSDLRDLLNMKASVRSVSSLDLPE